MTPNLEWMRQGICRSCPEKFDPIQFGTQSSQHAQTRRKEAVAVCRSCPVIEPCAVWALHNFDDDESVVGGLTGWERRRIRRELGLAKPRITLAAACGHAKTTDGICGSCLATKARGA